MFISNTCASFHLRWKGNSAKHQKVSKYYENDCMFILTIFFKIKEARLSFSQGIVTVLSIMENCQDVRVKLTNTKLNKLKFASKNKTGTILRINKKIFQGELTHELFLTTRQTNQTRNPFANNMPTDIKLSKVQIFKIIQSTN